MPVRRTRVHADTCNRSDAIDVLEPGEPGDRDERPLHRAGRAHPRTRPMGWDFDEAEISLISVVDPYWTLVSNIVFVGDGRWTRRRSGCAAPTFPAFNSSWESSAARSESTGCSTRTRFRSSRPPIVMANTIGDEGFKDPGIEAAWLTPLPWFVEVTGGVYQAIEGDDEHPLDFGSTTPRQRPVPRPFQESGRRQRRDDLRARPVHPAGSRDRRIRQRRLWRRRDLPQRAREEFEPAWMDPAERIPPEGLVRQAGTTLGSTDGGYASFQYRLSQVWWTGIRGEQVA